MRVFQNAGIYPKYLRRLKALRHDKEGFESWIRTFLDDRYGAAHFLLPVLNRDASAFFTNGDDELAQRLWACEHGMPSRTALVDVLLAQIEHHRTEVFYNLDPIRYGSDFVRKLPGCVRHSLAWRAAPSPGADFDAYDLVLCNFPSILEDYRQRGWRVAYFSPAHDPVMDAYACNVDRPIDVLFVGGYTRHHQRRAELLETVVSLAEDFDVRFCLDNSRLTQLAESPLGRLLPLGKHRRPQTIQKIACGPVFGLDLYKMLSSAKIVLNCAIDMAGMDRGNMRCFEAMGCGALMISDAGNYPKGMIDGANMATYTSAEDAVQRISEMLRNSGLRSHLAQNGHRLMIATYSKQAQWDHFKAIAEAL